MTPTPRPPGKDNFTAQVLYGSVLLSTMPRRQFVRLTSIANPPTPFADILLFVVLTGGLLGAFAGLLSCSKMDPQAFMNGFMMTLLMARR